MSGNEYNIAGDTGSGGGRGGSGQDGWLFLSPCSVRFFFFPTFIEKQNKNNNKKVAGSSGRIFSKSFN